MQFNPYITFDGHCADAFRFYEHVFAGRIAMMLTHKEMPAGDGPPMPEGWGGKVMHACLDVNGRMLMGSDRPPGSYQKAAGMAVQMEVDTPDEADRIFAALADGGAVAMPIRETFWARRFGVVTDRFGIPFYINCAKAA